MDEESLERVFRRIMAEHAGPLPHVLTMERAAEELSIGLTKLKGLVRSGELLACTVGLRKMIPSSEVRRLATPAPVKRHQRRTAAPIAYDAKAEAEKGRALLKAKRKKPDR